MVAGTQRRRSIANILPSVICNNILWMSTIFNGFTQELQLKANVSKAITLCALVKVKNNTLVKVKVLMQLLCSVKSKKEQLIFFSSMKQNNC